MAGRTWKDAVEGIRSRGGGRMRLEETEFIQQSVHHPDTGEYMGEEFTGHLEIVVRFMITKEAYNRNMADVMYKTSKRRAIRQIRELLEKQAIEEFSGGQQLPDGTLVYVSRYVEGKLVIMDPVTYAEAHIIKEVTE